MSHRRTLKPAYVWGALSNTEPPDDDEDVIGYYGLPDDVVVTPVLPPIPSSAWDYCATLKGYEPGDPQGYGATADEAVADLMEKVTT